MRINLLGGLTGRLHGAGAQGDVPIDDSSERDDAAWPAQARAARISLRPLTALLTVILIAVVAVYAGARLEKRQNGSSTAASSSSGLAAAFAARRGGGTGFGGGGAGATGGTGATGGAAATGTVTQITSKLLYLTSSTGALVKVKLTATTTFTRTAKSPTGGIHLGDTAVVQGAKNSSGVLVATSVIATAKGVTSAFGGGGGGFGGGAAGTAPAGAQSGG
jgi:hypothetical protein